MQPNETTTASMLNGAAGVTINGGTCNNTAGDHTRVAINVNINSPSNTESRASHSISDLQQVVDGSICEHCRQSLPLHTSEESVGVKGRQADAANVPQQASPQFIT